MIAAMLDAGGIDPTVINGGIINAYGSNARLGKSDWMVVEADESDGSFLRLDGTIAVVTNIDPEHLDHYGSFDAVKDAFVEFIENVPFYGARGAVRRPSRGAERHRAGSATGGWSPTASRRWPTCAATMSTPMPGGNRFDAVDAASATASGATIEGIALPMPGRHNVQNALAAIAVALELGIDDETIARRLRASSTGSSAASPRSARSTARRSSTITPTIRSRSARCCRRRAKARRAGSSRSSSRTATPGCAT